jgi:hypothetical protein
VVVAVDCPDRDYPAAGSLSREFVRPLPGHDPFPADRLDPSLWWHATFQSGRASNTTSRIEQMARELNRPLLVSADAWRRLSDANQWAVEDLGAHQLRGRVNPVQVYALKQEPTALSHG